MSSKISILEMKQKKQPEEVLFYGQDWDVSKWEKLGFESCEAAEYWKESSCAILCLKMVLDSLISDGKQSISALIKEGVELGAYTHKDGWNHRGLVSLAEKHGLVAKTIAKASKDDLQRYINEGCLILISTKWAFKNNKTLRGRALFWKKYGGHMALVIGYGKKGFFVHHTSIKPEYNWQGKLVPFREFETGFTGRCIVMRRR